ncbi:MAG: ATP-binding protein [Candidatus Methanomethyliaceae archaeon]
MSAFKSLIEEFERRKNRYHCVEMKGAFFKNKSETWTNLITVFFPLKKDEKTERFLYDYGTLRFFKKAIPCDDFLRVLELIKNEGKISIDGIGEYAVPQEFKEEKHYVHEFYPSHTYFGERDFRFDWPSRVYIAEFPNSLSDALRPISDGILNYLPIKLSLPAFPSVDSAVHQLVGIRLAYGYRNKLFAILPDYTARLSLRILSRKKIDVILETDASPGDFVCKYHCCTNKGNVQGDLVFKERTARLELEGDIERAYLYLLLNKGDGLLLDYKTLSYEYPAEGVEFAETDENIRALIMGGENERVEFKTKLPKEKLELLETIVAFANSRGGLILLGVDDNGSIVGMQEDKKKVEGCIVEWLRRDCDPPVEVPSLNEVLVDEKRVYIIKVQEGTHKPYFIREKGPYVRAGSTDRLMTRAELEEIYRKKYLPT